MTDKKKIAYIGTPPLGYRIAKILLDENTGVVSSAQSESSVYTDVRESHASGVAEQPQALVEGALEKITHSESCCTRPRLYMDYEVDHLGLPVCGNCGRVHTTEE